MIIEVKSEEDMRALAESIGRELSGGEVFELRGDVGAGKTTFVKGLAVGLEVEDEVQSPSFTISRVYEARGGMQLAHYDFYRLDDPGIMADELAEVVQDTMSITVVEWADVVEGVLPKHTYTVLIVATSDMARSVTLPDKLGRGLRP